MSFVLTALTFLPFIGALIAYASGWLTKSQTSAQSTTTALSGQENLQSGGARSIETIAGSGENERRPTAYYVALVFTLVTFLISLYSFWYVFSNTPAPGQYALTESYTWVSTHAFGLNYLVGIDGLSSPLLLLSTLLSFLAVFGSRNMVSRHQTAYYSLLLFLEGSMIGVFVSLNLIAFYIFWELALIPVFFLIGIWGGDRKKYAALKFIIYTFGGSIIMLLGFLSLYLGVTPQSFDIPDLAGKIPVGLQYLPLLATFIGFGVKMPLFPFHDWQPDAYQQSPAPVGVMLAGVLPKFAGYGFIRITVELFPQAAHQYAWAFIIIGIVSMFYGAFVAILSKDLKRMFAYTSINHMGFVVFGTFATVLTGNLLGVEGAILQMFASGFAVASLFMLSGYIEAQSGTTQISLLKGIRQWMPITATLLVVASCAAMGLPPFVSFLAEVFVILGGIAASYYAAITILVPVITGAYFLWMIKRTVLTAGDETKTVRDMPKVDAGVFAIYIIPLIVATIFSFLILSPSVPVAQWITHLVQGVH